MMQQGILKRLYGDGLQARALRGSSFTFLNFAATNVLRLGSNLILTRILFPEAFGLMAIVQVFMVAMAMFSDLGLRTSIVQSRRGDDRDFLDTAWTMQVLRGILIGLLTLAIARPVAEFYDQELLAQLLPVVGLSAVIQSFISTKVYTAGRHLVLARVTVLELSSQLVGIVSMIVLALIYKSVWALAIGGVVGSVFKAVLSHLYFPGQNNRFHFERAAFGELFTFGKYIFLSSMCGFLINNGDRAILGKFVPLAELAVYNIAYFLATVPLLLSQSLISLIMLPIYRDRPTEDSERNRRDIAKARALITGTMIAIAMVPALIGDWVIRFLYTADYHQAGPILVFISLAVMPTIIVASYSTLLMARGNSRGFFIILLVTALIQSACLFFGVTNFGVVGAVFAQPLASIAVYPLILRMLAPYRGQDLRHDMVFASCAFLAAVVVVTIKQDTLAQFLAMIP